MNTQRGVEVKFYSFFNLDARWDLWSTPRLRRFTSGNETRYSLYRRLGGPQSRSGQCEKIFLPPGFFLFLLFLFSSVSFLSIVCFYILFSSCHLSLYNTTQTSMPPGGIRTRNLSKWAAADPRLKPLGHRDRHGILFPHRRARSEPLYRPTFLCVAAKTLGVLLLCRVHCCA